MAHRLVVALSVLSGLGAAVASKYLLSVPLIQAVFASITGAALTFLIPYFANKLFYANPKTLTYQEVEEMIKKHFQKIDCYFPCS